MSTIPRKQLDELVTTYRLEPSLKKNIYVEGLTDKELIELYFKTININDVYVYEIATIDIPEEAVLNAGFIIDNNRNRVITLCSLLNESVYGIIDSDFDFIESKEYPSSILKTDYSAMESYLFNEKIMEKLFRFYTSSRPKNFTSFLNHIGEILYEVFLIRYAKEKLDRQRTHRDFESETKLNKDHTLSFERDKYLKNYLSSQKQMCSKFNELINNVKLEPTSIDYKYYIHGHDFIDILQFYLKIKHKETREHFPKLFCSLLDIEDLTHEKLFIDLKQLYI